MGKTTLLRHLFPQSKIVTFDPLIDIENAKADPDLFLRSQPSPVILDEIQYVPELVPALKRKVDQNRKNSQYLVTGSQQWAVMKTLAESLAGRVAFLDLHGFSLAEAQEIVAQPSLLENWLFQKQIDSDFFSNERSYVSRPHIFHSLWRGWFPETFFIQDEFIPSFYQGYQRTYLERDVRSIAEIKDLSLFQRFLSYCAALTAQEVNFSQFGREIGVSPDTAKDWLSILKATFQWMEVPAFSLNSVQKISQKPKGYLTDSGLICFLQSLSSPEALSGHPLFGATFESAVVMDIKKRVQTLRLAPTFYHWRVHSGAEIDLVLELDGVLFPIEIKSKSNPNGKDARGIVEFRKKYSTRKIAQGLVICLCDRPYPVNENDWAVPWDVL